MFKGESENTKDSITNVPLWFNETLDTELDFIAHQRNLEEEKKAFLKKSNNEEINTEKREIEELFKENITKGDMQDINAIDMATLESSLLKVNINPITEDDIQEDDEVPEWNYYTPEQIIKESNDHEDTWGISSTKAGSSKDYEKSYEYDNVSQNIFCPKYVQIEETDAVWYYKDPKDNIQGPFTPIQMYNWFLAGCFPYTLKVRLKEESPFIPIDMLVMEIAGQSKRTQGSLNNHTKNFTTLIAEEDAA